MAFNASHFRLCPPQDIQSFFEGRFYRSRYVFLVRDPISTILSVARLFSLTTDEEIRPQIGAWLEYVKLWADWLRTFPYTHTLLAEEIDVARIVELGSFIDLDLSGSERLLDEGERRVHEIPNSLGILRTLKPRLDEIYGAIKQTLCMDRILWQADQKRQLSQNDTRFDMSAPIALAPHPIGQAWALSNYLLEQLRSSNLENSVEQ